MENGFCKPGSITVYLKGGSLTIEYSGGEAAMTGETCEIYRGSVKIQEKFVESAVYDFVNFLDKSANNVYNRGYATKKMSEYFIESSEVKL